MFALDRGNQSLQLRDPDGETMELAYDYLVLAVEAASNDFATPSVVEHCQFIDSSLQAPRVWQQIQPLLESNRKRRVMPTAPIELSEKTHRALAEQGIDVRLNSRIQRAAQGQLITAQGESLSSDLQLRAAGI